MCVCVRASVRASFPLFVSLQGWQGRRGAGGAGRSKKVGGADCPRYRYNPNQEGSNLRLLCSGHLFGYMSDSVHFESINWYLNFSTCFKKIVTTESEGCFLKASLRWVC
jgi:hypothetical protein